MSDTPQGQGWWKASDDKWYPPELHPDYVAPAPAEPSVEPAASAEQPPVEPPAAARAEGAGGGKGGGSKVIIGVVVALALVAGAFVAITQLRGDEAAAAVDLDPIGSPGAHAFFGSFAPEPTASLLDFATTAEDAAAAGQGDPDQDGGDDEGADQDDAEGDRNGADGPSGTDRPVGYRAVDGSVPGLFGGTLNEAACDPDQLVDFLAADEPKAQAWAGVLEIDPADIGDYVAGLTPVNLGADTRVVTYGFVDGDAEARQAILQRGTAALIDRHGVPRVNCYSGSPLRQPDPIEGAEEYVGEQWESFAPAQVVVVDDAPAAQEGFDLRDVATGVVFNRPAGSKGDKDGPRVSRPAESERMIDGPIEIGWRYDDRLEDDRTEARYTFDAPDGAIITVSISNNATSNNRVRAELASAGSKHFDIVVNPGGDTEEVLVLDHRGAAEFELFFRDGPAAFTFQVDIESQDDAGQGVDAGDDSASALEIAPGSYEGYVGGADQEDRYMVELVPGADFRLSADVPREAGRIRLRVRHDGNQLADQWVNPGGSAEWNYLFSSDHDGLVEISFRDGPAAYSFSVTMDPQRDGGADGDAGGDLANAREVPVGEELSGRVGHGDRTDFYTFLHPGTAGRVDVHNDVASNSRIEVVLFDAAGNRVTGQRVNVGATETLEFGADQLDSVYRLVITDGPADYTFVVRAEGEGAEHEGTEPESD